MFWFNEINFSSIWTLNKRWIPTAMDPFYHDVNVSSLFILALYHSRFSFSNLGFCISFCRARWIFFFFLEAFVKKKKDAFYRRR